MEDTAQQPEVSSKLLSESCSEEMEREENLNSPLGQCLTA